MRPVPAAMSPELAATWYVPATTAHVALPSLARLGDDEVVVVAGALLVGYVPGASAVLDLPNRLLDDVTLVPVNMIRRDAEARACAPVLAERLTRGGLKLEVEQCPFEQVGDAIAALAGGRLRGRAVLVAA